MNFKHYVKIKITCKNESKVKFEVDFKDEEGPHAAIFEL